MNRSKLIILVSGLMLLITASCTSTGGTKSSSQDSSVIQPGMLLSDYLSKLPGVTVNGSGGNVSVNIRGAMSFHANTEPLYVVDGQRLGRSYARVASQVPVTDITSIKVVKGSEASIYGVQGGNGIIEITTKGN